MENTGKKVGGFFAFLAIVAGILLLTGVIGPKTGSIAKVLRWLGIASIVVGVVIVVLVIIVIIAAIVAARDEDPNAELKAGANQVISDRKKQLAKLKSQATIMKMNASTTQGKINSLDTRIDMCIKNAERYVAAGDEDKAREEITKKQELEKNRESLLANKASYDKSMADIERAVNELECEIAELGNRRDSAVTKMKIAKANQNVINNSGEDIFADDAFDKLDEKAQFEEDYADAMKELNKTSKY